MQDSLEAGPHSQSPRRYLNYFGVRTMVPHSGVFDSISTINRRSAPLSWSLDVDQDDICFHLLRLKEFTPSKRVQPFGLCTPYFSFSGGH